ncbi:MAG: zinc ribbon domain-containing protein, partial [Candidatus Geothermincolia bacterium]
MNCEKCGGELVPGKHFCTNCGAPIPEAQQAASPPQAPAATQGPATPPEPVVVTPLPVAAPKRKLADKGTGWKVLAAVLAALVLAGIVVGIVFIVKAVSGGGKPVAKISLLTIARKDGKKLDLKKVPLGVDLTMTAVFNASYTQGGRGTIKLYVEGSSGDELTGDTFEVKSSGAAQKQQYTLNMTAGSGKPVKAIAKLSVSSGSGLKATDEKSLSYTAVEGSIEEDENNTDTNTDGDLEQARENVQGDFDDLMTTAQVANAAGVDISDLQNEIADIGVQIIEATSIEIG